MATIESSSLPNGLPVHRIDLPGTRAVTLLVAFDAGARTERPEENGMAHFLEHLVFKGGQKYDHYRKVNETAEHMGAVLNAYTSHDLVAFHITCRAEVAGEALDLLSDFVGRPRLDADELDRERGVVIQEIARANDQPAFLVGNLSGVPDDSELVDLLCRFPSIQADGAAEPAPPFSPQTLVEGRESNQSHLRMSYRPSIDPTDVRQRAALAVYSTLLGGSMGSRLFDEIREQRGLAYSVYSVDHSYSDVPLLQLSAGLDSTKCIEAFNRMGEIVEELRTDGPTQDEFERARAYAA